MHVVAVGALAARQFPVGRRALRTFYSHDPPVRECAEPAVVRPPVEAQGRCNGRVLVAGIQAPPCRAAEFMVPRVSLEGDRVPCRRLAVSKGDTTRICGVFREAVCDFVARKAHVGLKPTRPDGECGIRDETADNCLPGALGRRRGRGVRCARQKPINELRIINTEECRTTKLN